MSLRITIVIHSAGTAAAEGGIAVRVFSLILPVPPQRKAALQCVSFRSQCVSFRSFARMSPEPVLDNRAAVPRGNLRRVLHRHGCRRIILARLSTFVLMIHMVSKRSRVNPP